MKFLGISIYVANGFIGFINLIFAYQLLHDGKWRGLLNIVAAAVSFITLRITQRSVKKNQERLRRINHDILETALLCLETDKPKGWELAPYFSDTIKRLSNM